MLLFNRTNSSSFTAFDLIYFNVWGLPLIPQWDDPNILFALLMTIMFHLDISHEKSLRITANLL